MIVSVPSPFEPGQVIARKYRVDRVIGSGGMGYVLSATHVNLGQKVAIKLLLPQVASNPEAVARFLREARRAVQIQSEHVARVLDIGELEDGAPYIVMEYLEGRDLDAILRERTTLPAMEVIGYVLQACEALSEAHALGIVHRDLKPANLFLAQRADGTFWVKLLDFGISKAATEGDARLTQSAAFLGSPLYSAPEQLMSSRDADARADIWSLGVILYEALAGVTPFAGQTVTEVIARIYQMSPRPLQELRPDLPPDLCGVVSRCLEKNRDARFANVGEFALALRPYVQDGRSIDRIARVMARSASAPDINAHVARQAQQMSAASSTLSAPASPTQVANSSHAWGPPKVDEPQPKPPGISTVGAWGEEQIPSPRRSASRAIAIALLGVVALVGGAALVALGFRHTSSSDAAAASPAPPTSTRADIGAPVPPVVALSPLDSATPVTSTAPTASALHPLPTTTPAVAAAPVIPAVVPPKTTTPTAVPVTTVPPKLPAMPTALAPAIPTTAPTVTAAPKKHDPLEVDLK